MPTESAQEMCRQQRRSAAPVSVDRMVRQPAGCGVRGGTAAAAGRGGTAGASGGVTTGSEDVCICSRPRASTLGRPESAGNTTSGKMHACRTSAAAIMMAHRAILKLLSGMTIGDQLLTDSTSTPCLASCLANQERASVALVARLHECSQEDASVTGFPVHANSRRSNRMGRKTQSGHIAPSCEHSCTVSTHN